MEKKTLYRFFEGIATVEEKEAIKQWVESSPEHYNELLRERNFFDAVILSEELTGVSEEKTSPVRSVSFFRIREILKVAAVIAIVLLGGVTLYTKKVKELTSAVCTVQVPSGQRATLTLPDGTLVWLNARSEIRYSSFVKGSQREVELNGEAYFEVAHNEKTPFIVRTSQYDVEVLGTSFNVEAYKEQGFFSTVLMEGSVKIRSRSNTSKEIILVPNYKVTLENGALITSLIDDYDPYRWREGLICFKNVDFIQLMQRFEKSYGIEIIVENQSLSQHVFSGKFRISDGIDNALRVLQRDVPYTFIRDSEEAVIYIK